MPTYNIRHLTRYTYEDIVPVCHNLAHLLPRAAERHEWRFADLDIHPVPAIRTDRLDYYGNRLTLFAIQEPHHELDVTANGQVTITPLPNNPVSTIPWEQARDLIASNAPNLLDPAQFAFESPYVRWTPEILHYASSSFTPGRPLLESVLDLTHRIHRDFTYDTHTTTVSTTLPEIMKARAGVCQDFAHLQIGCLRALGISAKYVSGYLLTIPPPGVPRLVGADASHAWLSVWLPDVGWLDLDPTNNLIPSDKHITLAYGRDFGDVSPLRGVILGAGRHHIDVSVDVTEVDATCCAVTHLPNF